jgi:hypothetical protein
MKRKAAMAMFSVFVAIFMALGEGYGAASAAGERQASNHTLALKLTRLERLLVASGPSAQTNAIILRAQIVADQSSTIRGRTGRLLAIEAANAVVRFLGLGEKVRQTIAEQLAAGKQINWIALAGIKRTQNAMELRARTLIRQARAYLL